MKALGIDFGEKRIGLAISDETKTFARELDILSPKEFWDRIVSIANENEIGVLVLGLPMGVSGQETEKTKEAREFRVQLVEITKLPVEFMDERFSSQMAVTISGSKKNLDSLAAQILLQNWLDKRKLNFTD